jgi:tetratricopeptide (TPR) repeat protein
LETSVALGPYAFINWNNLGMVYQYYGFHTNDKEYLAKAEDAYLMSIKNEGRYFRPVENLAYFYYFNADPQKTETFINQWIKVFPSDKLWLAKAMVEENKLGKHDDAIESAKTAFKLNPAKNTYQLYNFLVAGKPVEILQEDLFQTQQD